MLNAPSIRRKKDDHVAQNLWSTGIFSACSVKIFGLQRLTFYKEFRCLGSKKPSANTGCRHQCAAGLKARRRTKKPYIPASNNGIRVEWALTHLS
ncbi:unnamed protein product [Heligmosomoides polygyrus]|uniref:Transposase n=1 Tax=Heligmosomoides polygyrus TaxID=6339 RepID=A0A183G317_HELPZ|nr:unnamed protein product [Heligmosomoides polygyrus]